MSENKKYTIVVKRQRVEVSKAVYHAYHKAREAERDIKTRLLDNLNFPWSAFMRTAYILSFILLRISRPLRTIS